MRENLVVAGDDEYACCEVVQFALGNMLEFMGDDTEVVLGNTLDGILTVLSRMNGQAESISLTKYYTFDGETVELLDEHCIPVSKIM